MIKQISKEIKEKLIKMVTAELDNCGLYIGEPEETYLFSPIEDEFETYGDYFSWKVATGATKIVLFPPDMDYVIKIPFNGFHTSFEQYEDDYYLENPVPEGEEETFDYDEQRIIIEKKYYEEDPCNLFYPFSKASLYYRDGSDPNWDYCNLEALISEYAEEYNLCNIFVPTEWLFNYNGYPIYVQPKCEIEAYFEDIPQHSYNCSDEAKFTSKQKYKDKYLGYIQDTSWLAAVLENYGEETVNELINFIEEFNLGDLRDENRGLLDGKPVLIDYCGFYE